MGRRIGVLWFSGLSGITAVLVGFSSILLSISSSPWFSWTENALSDLGVGGSGLIFNMGLTISGLLMVPFSLGLSELSEGCRVWKIGSYILLGDAISLMGVGIFHEGFGPVHFYFSLAFFILMPLSLITLGLSLWGRGARGLSVFVLSTGLMISMVWIPRWRGAAIPEAISALAAAIWIIYLSLGILRSEARDRPSSCPLGRGWHP